MGNNKVSAFDTHLGLLDRKPVDGNTYSKMLYFTRSCLLLLANSLLLFFRFIARQVFRIKKTAGPRRDETSGSELRDWKPLMEENNERRMPMFSFKYQNPNQNLAEKAIVDEEEEKDLVVDGTPDTTIKANETHMTSADIHNYRFSPEKDFSGFIEEQEAMTFGVHESFSGFEEDNNFEEGDLGIGFLSAEDFLKPKVKSISEGDAKSDEFWRWGSLQSSGDLEEVRNLKCRLFGEKSNSMCSETTSASDREVKFNSDGFSVVIEPRSPSIEAIQNAKRWYAKRGVYMKNYYHSTKNNVSLLTLSPCRFKLSGKNNINGKVGTGMLESHQNFKCISTSSGAASILNANVCWPGSKYEHC
ncbi:hypothetical protein HPP92_010765 [Vanilla planifolia]|uniref:Uncharacterized protein n=1 Tax=Vanilla planifolia TaxID=51239 RepID=A0A835V4E0_VANPL|nr:hypothetical protein HPP92_010765 [Vanilla planifolia]